MIRFALFISLITLSACAAQTLPSSDRLEAVRAAKQEKLETELAEQSLTLGNPVFVRIFKQENTLETWIADPQSGQYALSKSYAICNYSGTLGPKLVEGDGQAPEGFYTISADQMNPWSRHQLSFNLGYPNDYDTAHGRTGSHLMVHGGCTSIGCYAMTDPAIEEIYLLVEASIANGHAVPVHAFPFRMTPRNIALNSTSRWSSFWGNLKQGYDAFELTKIPPTARHSSGKYVFQSSRPTTTLF